jgi:hypothetical protein
MIPEFRDALGGKNTVFPGSEHSHFSTGKPEKTRQQACPVELNAVPKFVPSGGLSPFGQRLAGKQSTRMNTNESKSRQIALNY